MKKILLIFFLLSLLLLNSCNQGITKVKYNIEDESSSLNENSSSAVNSEILASNFIIAGNQVKIQDEITYGNGVFYVNQSSKAPLSSEVLPYDLEEELVFDDSLLKTIILRNLNRPINKNTYTERVTISDCFDLKFDTLKITSFYISSEKFYSSASVRADLKQSYEYGKITTNPPEKFDRKLIKSYKVLSQIPSLKKIELYFQNSTFPEDVDKYELPITVDISPFFAQNFLVELKIVAFAGASKFTLLGLNKISTCTTLKRVELINCNITDGTPLLNLNPKNLLVLKYGGNPISSDETLFNNLKQKYPNAIIQN